MLPNMGTMDMSMSHDCHGEMSSDMADMEMSDHCESSDQQHETCDSKSCGACVSHCSSAVFTSFKSLMADESSLPAIPHHTGHIQSIHTRMLRPPRSFNS